MYDVADAIDSLPDDVRIVRVVELSGFGSRRGGEAVALSGGRVVAGRILAGLVDEALTHAPDVGVFETTVSDPAAEDAGMACGGRALLLVQPRSSIPASAWTALQRRWPMVLATDLDTGSTTAISEAANATGGSLGTASALLRSGRSSAEVVDGVLVESFLPPTTLTIVGRAAVGDALVAQAELLGWRCSTVEAADTASTAAGDMCAHDALVVLSHDERIDTPALAGALEHGRGYVGALGSRGTQAARRNRLLALGHDEARLATIHGPVGLDLGSRTPAETAVAIVAEIIAHKAGRTAVSLASHDGPING